MPQPRAAWLGHQREEPRLVLFIDDGLRRGAPADAARPRRAARRSRGADRFPTGGLCPHAARTRRARPSCQTLPARHVAWAPANRATHRRPRAPSHLPAFEAGFRAYTPPPRAHVFAANRSTAGELPNHPLDALYARVTRSQRGLAHTNRNVLPAHRHVTQDRHGSGTRSLQNGASGWARCEPVCGPNVNLELV